MNLVNTENLSRIYGSGETAVTALDRINLNIRSGEFLAVMGPSGCGKSTLLHLIGGLDRPTAGRIRIDDLDITRLDDDALTALRRRRIGFVFQFFNLIPVLTALENTALPLLLDGVSIPETRERAAQWLERLGMGDRLTHRPDQLSGGQQQRAAIARALITEPALVLADEPTGNLDTRAGDEIASLLRQIVSEWRRTVMMVTHDPRIAAYADRIIFLKDGRLVDETRLSGLGGQDDALALNERVQALNTLEE
ncbi:MAG: ABC transporter ATP-binding protein [Chloroflexota bacterium]|jgi:putative ABC transport system ATP-binding protein